MLFCCWCEIGISHSGADGDGSLLFLYVTLKWSGMQNAVVT